eukprot:GHVS01052485.1.p1 GENE.GHVS01052485.1~~GHVS01052485.1.p1  ORF type:complete len:250 (+),score=48.10 GHVS01052485.1:110-859(+)
MDESSSGNSAGGGGTSAESFLLTNPNAAPTPPTAAALSGGSLTGSHGVSPPARSSPPSESGPGGGGDCRAEQQPQQAEKRETGPTREEGSSSHRVAGGRLQPVDTGRITTAAALHHVAPPPRGASRDITSSSSAESTPGRRGLGRADESGKTSTFEHPLQLRIPRADCVGGTFGRHTEYVVELNDTGETLSVARRFRTFLELHEQITEELFGTGDVPEVGWASNVLGQAVYWCSWRFLMFSPPPPVVGI